MNHTPTYISTRAAAHLAGVEPHVLYTSIQRHGSYAGVVPRKGAAGRLSWPASAFRANLPQGAKEVLNVFEGLAGAVLELDPAALLSILHSVPYRLRSDERFLLTHAAFVLHALSAADRAEIVNSPRPALAKVYAAIAERAGHMASSVRAAVECAKRMEAEQ